MQAGGARHLRQPLHRAFDVLAGDHHQVGHFVDDDDDIGQRIEVELLFFVDRLAGFLVEAGMHRACQFLAPGFYFQEPRIVAVDIAHAEFRHPLVAFLHLAHRPFQRDHGLLRIGHDRRQQMRNAVIDGEFEHLGIDHDQAALIRPQPIDQAEDHGVDGDRFAGTGGAGDQQMRHPREIDDDGIAADILAETQRKLCHRLVGVFHRKQFAQIDFFAMRVRQFDADRVAAGDDGDARGKRAHRTRDVVGEPDDAGGFDAGRGLEFVQRHHRAGIGLDDFAADAEIPEHAFQRARIVIELRLAERLAIGSFGGGQHRHRRQFELVGGSARRRPGRGLLARGASGRGFVFFVFFVEIFFGLWRRCRRYSAAEIGLLTFECGRAWRRRARDQRAVGRGQQPAQPRFRAHQRVKRPSQRNRAAVIFIFFFLERRVVVIDRGRFVLLRT